jgi:MFS family permease
MFTLLRRRNFALLWFGGLISLIGDSLLLTALPFFVYQQSGSTLATAVMVAAELLPRFLLGSVAGVFVDRWDRKKIMVIANLSQAIIILPLLLIHSTNSLWIVYVVSFFQVSMALFFSLAENALLPLLVGEDQLLAANSLNALNNQFARLIGPPIGGLILAVWGLSGVVLFDSITFLIAGIMILLITQSGRSAPTPTPDVEAGKTSWARFWKEWMEGLEIVRKTRVVTVLFITVVLLNLGGIMIDPLGPAFMADVLKVGPDVFGWFITVQAVGGILGGLTASKVGQRLSPAKIYGWAEIILGVLLLLRYHLIFLPVVFIITFLIGFPAALGIAALETLFQQKVPNTHLGRISGALNTTVGIVSLFGVLGLSGALGDLIGIVPVLSIAAVITLLTGVIALLFLPKLTQ